MAFTDSFSTGLSHPGAAEGVYIIKSQSDIPIEIPPGESFDFDLEFGIVAPVGRNGVEELLYAVADQRDERIPDVARGCLEALGALLSRLKAQILEFDRQINAWHRSNEMSRRLDTRVSIEGDVGVIRP